MKDVFSSAILNRFWLGMTIMVSTTCSNSSNPSSAMRRRRPPSNSKGRLTTPTVKIPFSRAAWAMTGALPVPVPPPNPAATKTMEEPSSISVISRIDSSAAIRPSSTRPPVPKPWVANTPIWMRLSAMEALRDWASVLTTTKSTPSSWEWIILLTALQPAPPAPITVRRGFNSTSPPFPAPPSIIDPERSTIAILPHTKFC